MIIVKPEEIGFSVERMGRIQPTLQKYVDEKKLAGILSMVARRGKIAHYQKVGSMDLEAGKPMQFDTLFRIYSMTKPITSTAIMILLEEGRFQLNDPVSRFIPAFKDSQVLVNMTDDEPELVKSQREITIHDLLTHTAGLSYGFDKNYIDELYRKEVWQKFETDPTFGLEEAINTVAGLPLTHQPGTAFRYSMATDVLGYLVQVVSGKSLGTFLKERIFDPLKMANTSFYVPPEKVGRFAANYGPAEDGSLKLVDAPATSNYLRADRVASGGGGLVSTAMDYMRFCQMLLNKGELEGARILGRKTVELMTCNHLPIGVYSSENKDAGFGLGFGVLLNIGWSQRLGSAGNYYWGGAASTTFWIDPQEELIGLLMLQYIDGVTPVGADFNNLVYQALID